MTNRSSSGPHKPWVASAPQAWHALAVTEVRALLGTDLETGLDPGEASARLDRCGPNAIREERPRSVVAMFVGQFADFMIVVLLAAALVSGLLGDLADTAAILVIVLLNGGIGFIQEYRAERAMAALRQLAAGNARVLRDGDAVAVPVAAVVPGDIVLLEAGNIVPADLRLFEAARLAIDESLLTGESLATDKHHAPVPGADLPVGDRASMAYKGSTVVRGRGRGIVIATGMATELGRIAQLLDAEAAPRTPLQLRLASFGRRLGFAVLAICALVFVIGLARGEPLLLLFLTAVGLAVAAVPEALPAVVTISLALGAAKMARAHALIRRLPAVETLGSVTVICSDKTGTLTENRMRAVALHIDGTTTRDWHARSGEAPVATLLTAIMLCNDAQQDHRGHYQGEPTEVALCEAARIAGFDKPTLEAKHQRIFELPFDSSRQRMTTVHRDAAGAVAYTKGAPERVLPLCTSMLIATGQRGSMPAELLGAAERMAAEGMRVLAVAQREFPATSNEDKAGPEAAETLSRGNALESDLVFVGFIGLMDPPRREARDAVALCGTAGIRPVMITGDHPATALAVAREIGIATRQDELLTGPELASMSDDEVARRVPALHVFARVDPAQKIRIVEALQRQGEIVAMTGDGVNDAPALKRADIGVAMGRGGTDVAREASALVLLDDNFATIVEAVREGRRIYDNIRKFVRYVMTGNSGEIWTIFLAPLLGMPLPLLPIQILWINLVTDGLPGLALAAEPAERGAMQRPPRPPRESVLAHGMWQHMLWVGLLIGGASLFTQAWALGRNLPHWQTMVFTVLTLSQLAHVMAIRSERESLFRQGLLSNRPLLYAVGFTLLLQLAAIYVPVFNALLHTEPLTAAELALCCALSALIFVVVEIEKFCVRRGWLYAKPSRSRPVSSAP